MKEVFIDTQESRNKAWAFLDARMRSTVNMTTYSQKQQVRAERLMIGLKLVYVFKEMHMTARKNFISIKVTDARVVNKQGLALLESDYEKEGITKIVSPQGIIYRIPRA